MIQPLLARLIVCVDGESRYTPQLLARRSAREVNVTATTIRFGLCFEDCAQGKLKRAPVCKPASQTHSLTDSLRGKAAERERCQRQAGRQAAALHCA